MSEGHLSGVSGVVWYPGDTSAFLSSSYDGTVKVWDASSLSSAFTFPIHSPVSSLSLPQSPSAHPIASVGCQDDCVRLCDLSTGLCVQSLVGHQGAITTTEWAVDNPHHLVSGDSNGCVFLWDIRRADGVLVAFHPSTSMKRKSSIAPSPSYLQHQLEEEEEEERNGKRGGMKKRGGWRGDGGRRKKIVRAHEGAVTGLVFSREGRRVISHGVDNQVRVWETLTGKMEERLSRRFQTSHKAPRCLQMALCGDGSVLALPDGENVKIVDVLGGGGEGEGEEVGGEEDGRVVLKTLCGHLEMVNGVVCHPFSSDLYSCGNDEQILVWGGNGVGRVWGGQGGVRGTNNNNVNNNNNNDKSNNDTMEKDDEDDWSDDYSSDSDEEERRKQKEKTAEKQGKRTKNIY